MESMSTTMVWHCVRSTMTVIRACMYRMTTTDVYKRQAVAFAVAIGAEFMAESGLSLIDWEADWAERCV